MSVGPTLPYLSAYPTELQSQIQLLIDKQRLGDYLLAKYPKPHSIANDKALRDYVLEIKNRYLKKSAPLSKVIYDNHLHVIHSALGLHSSVSRVQGGKLKNKNELRIAAVFKQAPEAFLQMIVAHELAHLKEYQHNKAFYQLCRHMCADYHQLEFDMRVYLTHLELEGSIYR